MRLGIFVHSGNSGSLLGTSSHQSSETLLLSRKAALPFPQGLPSGEVIAHCYMKVVGVRGGWEMGRQGLGNQRKGYISRDCCESATLGRRMAMREDF